MGAIFIAPKRKGLGLTPLIDVVFILLLFFMLSSSFVRQQQISLASPVASEQNDLGKTQRLGLSESGDLFLWETYQPLSDKDLLNRFDLNKPLLISSQEETKVQEIVLALLHLDRLGFSQVSIGPLWLDEQ